MRITLGQIPFPIVRHSPAEEWTVVERCRNAKCQAPSGGSSHAISISNRQLSSKPLPDFKSSRLPVRLLTLSQLELPSARVPCD